MNNNNFFHFNYLFFKLYKNISNSCKISISSKVNFDLTSFLVIIENILVFSLKMIIATIH